MIYKTLPQPAKPNKQVQEYLNALNKGGRFVIPNGKSWYFLRPDSSKSSSFTTKEEAIAQAKQELAKDKGELFIFDKAGQLVNHQ